MTIDDKIYTEEDIAKCILGAQELRDMYDKGTDKESRDKFMCMNYTSWYISNHFGITPQVLDKYRPYTQPEFDFYEWYRYLYYQWDEHN